MNYSEISIESWKRKDIFKLFKTYDDPYFNITFEVDVSNLYRQCRYKNYSFFLASLYMSTKAANAIDGFKLRFKEEQVIQYDKIDFGSTILLEDNTFTFCYFEYLEDFEAFHAQGSIAINDAKTNREFKPKNDRDDLIHYSVIPWISLTSFKNARRGDSNDAVPKIVFGKVHEVFNKKMMPVSVELHHAMADGWDVGRYFDLFQKACDGGLI